ncbi:MAG: minichromosome maintenance protein MCM, partial [archaeon]|nr:minichromosome maintenance protein MCM [archaeon]
KKYCWTKVIELSNAYPERRSLIVKFHDIDIYNPNLADMLLEDPDVVLPAATRALREMDIPTGVTLDHTYLRIIKLPNQVRIRDIRSEDIGKLISIEGLVLKATEVRPRIIEAVFECLFCHHIFSVEQSGREFKEPVECEQESGGCGRKAQRFKLLVDKSKFVNAQKIRLQDSPEDLRGGELPQIIDVNLENDLSGIISPGDRINVVGVLRSYQSITKFGRTCFFDVHLESNSVEKRKEEFEEIRITEDDEREIEELKSQPDVYKKLISSIAPSIYGYSEIKEAILLQLFGGVSKTLPDGTRLRGDIHVLLVGDPGIAKSNLLSHISKLAPRGLYAVGSSSSGVGLTAAAVRDPTDFGGGRWTLEAGALVLADKGIAAVDEFEKLRKEDKEKLHEALEQQSVTVSKAGINAKLNARCALLAAANPKYGRFDLYQPLSKQIDMPPVLLSRFDLIFTMIDKPDKEADRNLAKHIISAHALGEIIKNGESAEGEDFKEFKAPVEPNLLRKYISMGKRINPKLTKAARKIFEEFYVELRSLYDSDNTVPVTARQLEALIRLGEARARTRLSPIVTIEDAERVINLVTHCLRTVYVDPETGRLDVDWVTAGTTKTQRDRSRMVVEIIHQLERDYGDEVPVDEILASAEERGIEREKGEKTIDELKRDGIIFSPSKGVLRFLR